jgi:hypothetical protein
VIETFGEAKQDKQSSVKEQQSRPCSWEWFGAKEHRGVAAYCELQQVDQVANRRKAKDNENKVSAYLPREVPAPAINRESWKESLRENFRNIALSRFSKVIGTMPFPESPVDGGRRRFLSRAADRCLPPPELAGMETQGDGPELQGYVSEERAP